MITKDLYEIKKIDRDLYYPYIKKSFLICDVGGSFGIDAYLMSKLANVVVNVDINLHFMKTGMKNIKKRDNIVFVCASACNLPFRDNVFNMNTCFSVLDHLPNKNHAKNAIYEISRTIIKNGFVSITVPNKLFFLGTIIMKIKQYIDEDAFFEQRFTPKELYKLILDSKLQTIFFKSKYPTIIGESILNYNFPKMVKRLPKFILAYLFMIMTKIFGIMETMPFFKYFGARMGYLSIKK